MTDDQINIAIFQHLGGYFMDADWHHPNGARVTLSDPRPSYASDLNAMHEAEMSLPIEGVNGQGFDGSRSEFRGQLRLVCEQPYHATARQRAEALLRAFGKWKEEA